MQHVKPLLHWSCVSHVAVDYYRYLTVCHLQSTILLLKVKWESTLTSDHTPYFPK